MVENLSVDLSERFNNPERQTGSSWNQYDLVSSSKFEWGSSGRRTEANDHAARSTHLYFPLSSNNPETLISTGPWFQVYMVLGNAVLQARVVGKQVFNR